MSLEDISITYEENGRVLTMNDGVFATPIKSPAESGNIIFNIEVKPVSNQSTRAKKDVVTNAIRAVTKPIEYLLSGDIAIEIEWFINEDERYESDKSPDVDNIIKPILDALSGPQGLIIDDCQVQFISCHWLSRFGGKECINLTIKYDPEEWYKKANLIFVQLHMALCMPLCGDLPPNQLNLMLDAFEQQVHARERILAEGGTDYMAKGVMSLQRFFHKTRINNFTVITLEELRKKGNATLFKT